MSGDISEGLEDVLVVGREEHGTIAPQSGQLSEDEELRQLVQKCVSRVGEPGYAGILSSGRTKRRKQPYFRGMEEVLYSLDHQSNLVAIDSVNDLLKAHREGKFLYVKVTENSRYRLEDMLTTAFEDKVTTGVSPGFVQLELKKSSLGLFRAGISGYPKTFIDIANDKCLFLFEIGELFIEKS